MRTGFALLTSLLATLGTAAGAPLPVSEVQGDWQGAIDTGDGSLRVVFHLAQDADGRLTGTMDSPDQGAMGVAISYVSYMQPDVHLTIARFDGAYEGKLDKDKLQIVGIWKQGRVSLPLTLGRAGRFSPPPSAAGRP